MTADGKSPQAAGRIVPIAAAVSALAVSIVAGLCVVGIAVALAGLEHQVKPSERSTDWIVALALVAASPAIVMALGAILMLRRQVAGRVIVSTIAALATALIALIAMGHVVDGNLQSALEAAVVAAAPAIVLLLATTTASKDWTGRLQIRPR
ncbi:hypothetical protein [Nocardia sp. NPDC058666]|uniref:hypothetical protein n=1 Tax=Nocardia sp. NPDC058666 TaxID=3346587 RepID=UPI003661B801